MIDGASSSDGVTKNRIEVQSVISFDWKIALCLAIFMGISTVGRWEIELTCMEMIIL